MVKNGEMVMLPLVGNTCSLVFRLFVVCCNLSLFDLSMRMVSTNSVKAKCKADRFSRNV